MNLSSVFKFGASGRGGSKPLSYYGEILHLPFRLWLSVASASLSLAASFLCHPFGSDVTFLVTSQLGLRSLRSYRVL